MLPGNNKLLELFAQIYIHDENFDNYFAFLSCCLTADLVNKFSAQSTENKLTFFSNLGLFQLLNERRISIYLTVITYNINNSILILSILLKIAFLAQNHGCQ